MGKRGFKPIYIDPKLLQTRSSFELAVQFKVSPSTVRRARRRLSIHADPYGHGWSMSDHQVLIECILEALYSVNVIPMRTLLERVHDHFGSVSERTVYRALTQLQEQGTVERIAPPNTNSLEWGYTRKDLPWRRRSLPRSVAA